MAPVPIFMAVQHLNGKDKYLASHDTDISTGSIFRSLYTKEYSMSMDIYDGYVYLWYDTKAKLFYVGGHYGRVDDNYVASNKPLKRAYKKRPETFRLKILQYVIGSTTDLRVAEQRWLDMIKPSELLTTENVYNETHRYYNVKRNATGGNGKGTNKGKSTIGGWNRGLKLPNWHSPESRKIMSEKKKAYWANKRNEVAPLGL